MADDLIGFNTEQYSEVCSTLSWLFPEAEDIKVVVLSNSRGAKRFSERLKAIAEKFSNLIVKENISSELLTKYKFLNVVIEVKDKSSANNEGTTNQNY